MFFQRYDGDRYGVGKPYGYSLYLSPFIAVLGPVHGVAVGNTLLLAAMMLISILLLRTRYDGPVVPLLTGAFYLASYVYMYAFWVHSELFLGLLTLIAFAGAVRFAQTGPVVVGGPELRRDRLRGEREGRLPRAVRPDRARDAVEGAHVAAAHRAAARRAARARASPSCPICATRTGTASTRTAASASSSRARPRSREGTTGFAATNYSGEDITLYLDAPVSGKLEALAYTFVGRHTGMLVYLPVALLLLVAALAHVRRADAWGRAALLSVLGYVLFYAFFFPTNYFGGGQSLGNRYFLQAAPAIIAMVVLMRLPRTTRPLVQRDRDRPRRRAAPAAARAAATGAHPHRAHERRRNGCCRSRPTRTRATTSSA